MKILLIPAAALALLLPVAAVAGPGCGGCGQGAEPPSCHVAAPAGAAGVRLLGLDGDTVALASIADDAPAVLACLGFDASDDSSARLLRDWWRAADPEPGFGLWAIACGDPAHARSAVERVGLDFPVLLDPGRAALPALGIGSCPELVFLRAGGEPALTSPAVSSTALAAGLAVLSEPDRLVDPVCGMAVSVETAAATWRYQGVDYYFCAEACRQAFAEYPAKYLGR